LFAARDASAGDLLAVAAKHLAESPAGQLPLLTGKEQAAAVVDAFAQIGFDGWLVGERRLATVIDERLTRRHTNDSQGLLSRHPAITARCHGISFNWNSSSYGTRTNSNRLRIKKLAEACGNRTHVRSLGRSRSDLELDLWQYRAFPAPESNWRGSLLAAQTYLMSGNACRALARS
jgi:hypothetical protein